MKDIINILKGIIKKYRTISLLIIIGIGLIVIGRLSWTTYFSKVQIFNDMEKEFTESAKRYYEFRKQLLPKEGYAKDLTLQDLYDNKQIDDLYVPKSRKMCDVNSFVRVYKKDGEYKYITYLKCGNFQSKIDHKGPEINLKGDKEITILVNEEFKDPGVESVKDNRDGKIDTSKVVVDSSKLDTTKLGSYDITYTVVDSTYNKATVTRTVVVRKGLTETIKENVKEDGYYKGSTANNYLLFSGMLWRIVNVNNDGTIKIITDSNIASTTYAPLETDFDNSNIKEWLNNYFYKYLNNPDPYIINDAKWCVDYSDNPNAINDNCTNYVTSKVGLIDIGDFNRSFEGNGSYLNNYSVYWLLTKKNSQYVYTNKIDMRVFEIQSNELAGVRPSLMLKNNLYAISGDGTLEKPYRIGDYKSGKINDKLNTRLVGEYVNYSGTLFRISGFDNDDNIKLTSVDAMKDISMNTYLYGKYEKQDSPMIFNPKDEGNIGYILNDDYTDYMDMSKIVSSDYTVYTFDINKKFSEYEKKNSFKAKLSIPLSYELFSNVDSSIIPQVNYWLLDYVADDMTLFTNGTNGKSFYGSFDEFNNNAYKLTLYLANNVKIKSGKGTIFNPYYIQ